MLASGGRHSLYKLEESVVNTGVFRCLVLPQNLDASPLQRSSAREYSPGYAGSRPPFLERQGSQFEQIMLLDRIVEG